LYRVGDDVEHQHRESAYLITSAERDQHARPAPVAIRERILAT